MTRSQHHLSGLLAPDQHKSHLALPFEVPPGTTRLSGRFETSPQRSPDALFDNMICLGLTGPLGPRGARHNNPDRDFTLCAAEASPGYLPGAPEPGTWQVHLDLFRLLGPVRFDLTLTFDDTPVEEAPPAPQRTARSRGPGWYRGDLHAHTLHSDSVWDVPGLLGWAVQHALDFVTLSDHNTTSGHAEFHHRAPAHLLTLGGMELTTHHGHALALGGTTLHDWRCGGATGKTMADLARAVQASGALFVIAHPMSPGDPACTGCRWEFPDVAPGPARLVEIWNGGPWSDYNEAGLALFRHWLAQGHRLVATAGSDTHGPDDATDQPGVTGFITVFAEDLSEAAILAAVAAGHSYLSSGPALVLTAQDGAGQRYPMGSTAPEGAAVRADWSDAPPGLTLRFVDAAGVLEEHALPQEDRGTIRLGAPASGFVMAELRGGDGRLYAVTNPLFLP